MHENLIEKLLERKTDSNKYNFGHVLVVGGSPGMVGAPFLAAMGALRIGAGLVTIASSFEVIEKLEKRVVEIMTLRLNSDRQSQIEDLVNFVENRHVSALAIGPGMNAEFSAIVPRIIDAIKIPIVIDAGALSALNPNLDQLDMASKNNSEIVLTPHDGEFEKLSGKKLPLDIEHRKEDVINFAVKHKVTLVSKGNPTLVGHSDSTIYENHTGNPGLSSAGTGDVLCGIISGLIAQGFETRQAADLGVYLHGLAGDLAAEEKTQPGMIASDVFEFIPETLKLVSQKDF